MECVQLELQLVVARQLVLTHHFKVAKYQSISGCWPDRDNNIPLTIILYRAGMTLCLSRINFSPGTCKILDIIIFQVLLKSLSIMVHVYHMYGRDLSKKDFKSLNTYTLYKST